MSAKIKLARQIFAEALKDPGLHISYVANIAMLLYDELDRRGYRPSLQPQDREEIAKRLLKLLFEVGVSNGEQ